ncbi:MFS transporter [Jatrophihabitans endophyticus]|uniref:MFS transporter n=1 Tax=Jatrophihabitans endophyticus TaxID=1206085 RepID=UPI001161216F|nr:MFS transporter [Jatrophihabitans endophyticus]
MAKRRDDRPGGRFSRSGHTTHLPRSSDAAAAPDERQPHDTRPDHRTERIPDPYRDDYRRDDYRRDDYRRDDYRRDDYRRDDYRRDDYDRQPERRPGYGAPTYHRGTAQDGAADAETVARRRPGVASAPTVGGSALNLGKATISGTGRAARTVTRKVITASRSDGAAESGLTALIWNQVLSYGTDAMVTVALAGTVFFGASADAQRGNVLLYLLVTMAPFAVVAPIIGPALDRLQHGRRWTMAGTAVGRAVLALIMAGHPTELLVLYPCALGSLVLSKAYAVVRAAATPRLVPPNMTLTEANAKLTVFGLASTVVLGGAVGAIIKVTGSYTAGLIVTAAAFAACAWFAFKLPKQVDSAVQAPRHPEEPARQRRQGKVPPLHRLRAWARRGFDPHLVIALQGESVLRLLSGMLTIYLAFYVESTSHGLTGVVQLAGVVGGAGAGNFVGTAIGTRLKMVKPELTIVVCTVVAAVVCVLAAITFSVLVACIAMFLSAVTNALSKIALDALIQQDVLETLRSSAFARSETFLQLAWVLGAALGVALPSNDTTDGRVALVVAAVVVGLVAGLVVLRSRATSRPQGRLGSIGSVVPRSSD